MKLSVVIPAFNEEETIREQLDALLGQECECDWEAILSDNRSTDETLAIAGEYAARFSHFRIIHATDKRGASHARNTGAKAADGDYLAFVDADDVVDEHWVNAICKALQAHDFIASRWDCSKLNAAHWDEKLSPRTCTQTKELQQYKYPPFLPHSGGCGLGIKKSLHEAVGGFDESIRLLEDTDYCWRVQLQGTPLVFAADALVHIRFPADYRDTYRQARSWGEFNVLLYKLYQDRGMPKLKLNEALQAWWKLLLKIPKLYSPYVRSRWLRDVNWRLGRIKGSLKHHILGL